MKNICLFIAICVLITTPLLGQKEMQQNLELKMRIPELASSTLNLGIEYFPTQQFSVEVNSGVHISSSPNLAQGLNSDTDFYVLAQGRFYLFPHYGADKLYFGTYGLYEYDKYNTSFNQDMKDIRGIIGGMLGYKLMPASVFSVDLGFGFGKFLTPQDAVNGVPRIPSDDFPNIHSLIYLSIGYRFN